ncbi:MAG: hypothetical protein EBZ77_14665, partial [Chitinophagia bacterium]|nr:hypothetical protein [Chitinophagia bacterium]
SCGAAADSVAVTVTSAPVVGAISGPTSVCAGNSIALSDTTIGGAWSSANTAVASVNTTGTVTGIAGGTAIISYSLNSFCGIVATTYTVTVNPAPDAGVISGSNSVCVTNSITLTSTVSGGTWRVTNSNATINSTGVLGGLATGLDTVYYIYTNSCGTDTATFVVNVGTPASAGTITGPSTVCTGSTMVLSNTTTGGSWISSNNTVGSVSSTGTVYGVTAGSVTITYMLVSSCGFSITTAPVTVNPSPVAGVITGTSPVCAGNSLTYTTTGTGGNWSSSNAAVATVSSAGTVTGMSSGIAIISYSVTNSCGTASDTQAIRVNAAPDAGSISGATPLCPGTTTTLSTTGTGGSWSSSNAAVATVHPSTGVVTGVAAGTATITYLTTSANCGSDTATALITVNNTATAGTLSGPSTVCAGGSVTLTSTVSGGTWTSSNPSVATVSSTGVVTGLLAGSATISYSVSGSCGSAATSTPITVAPAPSAGTVSGPATLCPTATGTFTTTGTGGTWSSTNPS